MAFASLFLAMIFISVVLIGLIILIVGIALDIVWGVRKKKKLKVSAVLKVFAILLTVIGVIFGIGPLAVVAIVSGVHKYTEYAEIKDLDEDDLIYGEVVLDEFDFHGDHYVRVEEAAPQSSHENFHEEVVGALIENDGDHRLIYSVDNTLGITILDIEVCNDLFIKEDEVGKFLDYYENEAPLYCVVDPKGDTGNAFTVDDIDSEHVRKIRDLIKQDGNVSYADEFPFSDRDGSMLFYSTDDVSCFDFWYGDTDKGFVVSCGSHMMVLDEEDAEFIRSLVEE